MELVFTGEFPPMKGGIGSYVFSRCCFPPPDGLRVLAAQILDESRCWDAGSGLDIRRFSYRHGSSLLLRLAQLRWANHALALELSEHRYRAVTANLILPFAWVACRHKRKRGHRVAAFCHSGDVLRPLFSAPTRYLYLQALKLIDLFIANSSLTAEKLMEQGCRSERIVVIHPPVDVKRFNPNIDGSVLRESWTNNGTCGPVLLTVSRLDELGKGIDSVLRALPRLRREFPDMRYVIVGDGPSRPKYEAMVRELHCGTSVVFAGSVADDLLPKCYAACDVFILATRPVPEIGFYEGFGIVYREAMACGKPVIVSSEAGACEIIVAGENGIVVDPTSVDDISEACLQLFRQPGAAAAMGKNAIAAARLRPDWSAVDVLS